MSYLSLQSRSTTAALDTTGLNDGNLTNAFTARELFPVAQYELYHMVVTDVPAGANGAVYIGARQWGFTFPNSGSEWDPSQPMLLTPGQEIYILWNIASPSPTGLYPVVTGWFRYDPSLPGNNYS